MALAPYNLKPMKSRARPQDTAKTYRAIRQPPEQPEAAEPHGVPYPVTLVREDGKEGEWVATIEALPGCRARGASPDEALEQISAAAAAWIEAAEREGKDVPETKPPQSHSGRLLLRMPQTLHAELARVAERERVSLNQFINDTLSGALGWRGPARDAPGGTRMVPTDDSPDPGKDELSSGPVHPQQRSRLLSAVFVANGVIVALAAVVAVVVLILALR
jgi:antitoxin HicB